MHWETRWCGGDAPAQCAEEAQCCPECGKDFPTEKALVSHRVMVHGLRSPVRELVAGTHCPRCLIQFWTRERLRCHVQRSKRCLQWHEEHIVPVDEGVAQDLDANERPSHRLLNRQGYYPRYAEQPAMRLHGPLLS